MTTAEILTGVSIVLVLLAIAPLLKPSHSAKINLSVWAVITANAWLAALGNLFSEQKGLSAIYMLAYALIVTPVLFCNFKKGAWSQLPSWHKYAAPLLPLGTLLGILLGGEMATWSAFTVSLLLTIQLVESTWTKVAREHLITWSLGLISNTIVLTFDWTASNLPLRCLLGLWMLQNLIVIGIELRNRKKDTHNKSKKNQIEKQTMRVMA